MSDVVNVLYVEDNEGDVELLKMSIERYCSSLNIVLDVAETVSEAKALFKPEKHILALIDWNLPDGEGIDVLQFIRNTQQRLPIFMLSGVVTPEHVEDAEKFNPTQILEKDYDKSFIQKIETCISLLR